MISHRLFPSSAQHSNFLFKMYMFWMFHVNVVCFTYLIFWMLNCVETWVNPSFIQQHQILLCSEDRLNLYWWMLVFPYSACYAYHCQEHSWACFFVTICLVIYSQLERLSHKASPFNSWRNCQTPFQRDCTFSHSE